jgi:hypothetical protein
MALAFAIAVWLHVSLAGAQELEPRAYRPAPSGLNFALLGYQFTTGNVLGDPTAPLQDLDVDANIAILGYLRTFGLFGRSSSVTVTVPYIFLSGSAVFQGEPVADSRSGAADTRVRLAVNLIGGPAMTPQEFASFPPGRALGFSLTVQPPTGQYDPTRIINFGSNRWSVKPEIGYSSIKGPWIFEAAIGVWFFTDNTEFVGSTRSQDPIGSFQAHLTYNFPNRMWLAVSANYYTGGQTAIDGVDADDLQNNSRFGLALSVPLGGPHSVKIAAHTGAFTSAGADFDVGTVVYQYRW